MDIRQLVKMTVRKRYEALTDYLLGYQGATWASNLEEVLNVALTDMGQEHPREASVIRLRWGLDKDPMKLAEVGIVIGVSASRVQQIERKGFQRIRHVRQSKLIRETLIQEDKR